MGPRLRGGDDTRTRRTAHSQTDTEPRPVGETQDAAATAGPFACGGGGRGGCRAPGRGASGSAAPWWRRTPGPRRRAHRAVSARKLPAAPPGYGKCARAPARSARRCRPSRRAAHGRARETVSPRGGRWPPPPSPKCRAAAAALQPRSTTAATAAARRCSPTGRPCFRSGSPAGPPLVPFAGFVVICPPAASMRLP